jgi:hypothetical protein
MSDDRTSDASQQAEADKPLYLVADKAIVLSQELLAHCGMLRSTAERYGAESRAAQIQAFATMRFAQPLVYLRTEEHALHGGQWQRLRTVNRTLAEAYEDLEANVQHIYNKAQFVHNMHNRAVSKDPTLSKDLAVSKRSGFWEPFRQLEAAVEALKRSHEATRPETPVSANSERMKGQGQRLAKREVQRRNEILRIEKNEGLNHRNPGDVEQIIAKCKDKGINTDAADLKKIHKWRATRDYRKGRKR